MMYPTQTSLTWFESVACHQLVFVGGVPETGTQTAHEIVLQNVGYPVCGAHGGFLHVFVSEELVVLGRYGTCHALVFGNLNMCSEVHSIQRGWERAWACGGTGYKWPV